jgi:hypothetical protein
MYRSRSIAGILVCLVCLLSACGNQPSTIAETSQPQEDKERNPEQVTTVPATVTDAAPVAPSAIPTGALLSPLPTATVPITPHAEGGETRPLSPLPLPVRPGPIGEQGPVPGEVPEDLLKSIVKDLQERKGIGREAITIERAAAVVWNDGSLGCPQKGMMYTQALVPGYLVVLEAGGDLYNYHAGESGHFILCERSLPGQIVPPGGGIDPLLEK